MNRREHKPTIAAGPSRPNGKSQAWETVDGQREQIQAWLRQDLTLTKVHTLCHVGAKAALFA